MWKSFIGIYGKWILICLIAAAAALGVFAIYFKIQYPQVRMRNYQRSLDSVETLIQQRKWYKDLDYEFAEKTLQQTREMILNGELEYRDFAKLRILNAVPRDRRLQGREYNEFFQELNRLLQAKRAGNLDLMNAPAETPSASLVEILPATP